MNNNDLAFIRSKFDMAQPDVPDSLSEFEIRNKILSKQEHIRINFEQKKRISFQPILTVAACFILAAGILAASGQFTGINESKAAHFKSYDELNSVVAGLEKQGSGDSFGSGSSLFQDIYTPDDLKNSGKNVVTNGEYIFHSYYNHNDLTDRNKVYIFRADGAKSELIKIMDDIAPSDDYNIGDLFLADNSLIVTMCDDSDTIVKTYDVSDPASPVLINEFKQDGMLVNSYMTDGVAYLVSYYGIAQGEAENFTPKSANLSVKPKNIYRFDDIKTASYIVIGAVDIKTGKSADEARAILGCNYKTYITDGYLYAASDSSLWTDEAEEIEYIKYDLKSGKAVLEAPERVNLPSHSELADDTLLDVSNTLIRLDDSKLVAITDRINQETGEELDGLEIVLYDVTNMSKPIELDKLALENSYSCNDISQNENGVFVFSTYFADDERRYYGAEAFEIKDDKIELKGKFVNDDNNLMYQGGAIIIGNYIYSFDQNDMAKDDKKLTIYSHKLG